MVSNKGNPEYPGSLGTNNGVQRCSLEVMPCSLAGVIACSRHTDQRWWGHVKEGKNSKGVGVGVGREGEGTLLSISSPFFPLLYISCHSPPPEDLEQTTGVITYLV